MKLFKVTQADDVVSVEIGGETFVTMSKAEVVVLIADLQAAADAIAE